MADHDHEGEIERYGRCLTCTDRGLGRSVAVGPAPGEQLSLIGTPDPDPPAPSHLPPEHAARLGKQARRVIVLMVDGEWRTLSEISERTGDPEASISARLRDLRRADHGGYVVDARPRFDGHPAPVEYRVTLPRAT